MIMMVMIMMVMIMMVMIMISHVSVGTISIYKALQQRDFSHPSPFTSSFTSAPSRPRLLHLFSLVLISRLHLSSSALISRLHLSSSVFSPPPLPFLLRPQRPPPPLLIDPHLLACHDSVGLIPSPGAFRSAQLNSSNATSGSGGPCADCPFERRSFLACRLLGKCWVSTCLRKSLQAGVNYIANPPISQEGQKETMLPGRPIPKAQQDSDREAGVSHNIRGGNCLHDPPKRRTKKRHFDLQRVLMTQPKADPNSCLLSIAAEGRA
jgi:hypothetical protein